jgi:hypothetical protein
MLVEPIYFFQHQRHYYVFVIKYSASSGYRGNSNPGNVFHEVLEIFEPVFLRIPERGISTAADDILKD